MTRSRRWLGLFYVGRAGHSMMFSAYSGVLPAVSLAWGLSASEAGAIQSAWHLGFLVSLFAAGILADRHGARPTVLRSSQLAAASALLFAALADGFWSAFLLYGLAGLCTGGTYTPALKLIFEEADPDQRGRAMGGYLAAGSVGYALALGSIALLVAAGWRAGLLCAACGALIGSVFVHRALAGMDDRRPAGACPSPLRGMTDLRRNPAALGCIGAYTAHCWELLGMWAWLPAFVTAAAAAAAGADPIVAGASGIAVAGLSHLVSAAGSVAGGGLSDRYGRAAVMMAATAASLASSLAFGWLFAAPLWAIAALALLYNLAAIADSPVYSTALAEVVPPQAIGAAYSLRSLTGFAAGALAPWVFGLALDAGRGWWGDSASAWALAWSVLAAGGLVGMPLIAIYRRHARLSAESCVRN